MFNFDNKRWDELSGGYKIPYDPRPALRSLESGDPVEPIWNEFWEELHHQGDVSDASYAAVPFLVRYISRSTKPDWNPYGLVGVIEIERHRKTNPPIPDWIADAYFRSWKDLLQLGSRDLEEADDPITIQVILGILALAKGEVKLGAFIAKPDTSEIKEFLDDRHAWTTLYRR